MRNFVERAAAGPPPDDGVGSIYTSTRERRKRRRRQAVMGGVGLAALLGAGAFIGTQDRSDGGRPPATDVGAPAIPQSGPAAERRSGGSSAAATTASAVVSATAAAPLGTRTGAPVPTDLPDAVAKRVAAARSAAATHGVKVQRPLPTATRAAVAAAVTVTRTGDLRKDKATMRVASAHADLSGYRELSWAADAGKPVGDASCTQNFRFSAGAEPARKPTLLLCWRTSADKSVYTVLVDLDGEPSQQRSVTALNKEWNRLG